MITNSLTILYLHIKEVEVKEVVLPHLQGGEEGEAAVVVAAAAALEVLIHLLQGVQEAVGSAAVPHPQEMFLVLIVQIQAPRHR